MPEIINWGLIPYDEALQKQEALVQSMAEANSVLNVQQNSQSPHPGVLVFCSHPPTVTLGRKTEPADVFAWEGPKFEINRGGRATYHGPSQQVIYPIWNLAVRDEALSWPRRDIHFYLRSLESILIRTLKEFGIVASNRSGRSDIDAGVEETGVWVEGRKIASIGIGIRKWISFHGIALNVEHDPLAFQGIRPCGFSAKIMTSMEELLGYKPERHLVQEKFVANFARVFLKRDHIVMLKPKGNSSLFVR